MGDDRGRARAIASALAATAALYGWLRESRAEYRHPSTERATAAVLPHHDAVQREERVPRSMAARKPAPAAEPLSGEDDPLEPEYDVTVVFEGAGNGAFAGSPADEPSEIPAAEELTLTDEAGAGEGACGEGSCAEASCAEASCGEGTCG